MSDQASTESGNDATEGATRPRQAPYVVALYRFHENIDALRQLHEEICGHAAELDKQRMGPEALSAVQSLSPERRQRFQAWLEEAVERESDEEHPESGLSQSDETELESIFGGNRAAAIQAWLRMQRVLILAPSRETLLRASLLTMAVSAFEALVGNLAARHFELRPKTLGKEPKFSLEKLSEFGSVEEILDAAIAFRVFQLLQERLADWTKWFDVDSGLGIKLPNLAIDYQQLEELIQRRHIIVHNGGVVSSQYLERVHFDGEPPQLGEPLPIDEPYLQDALDHLDAVGSLLCIGAWSKDQPEQESEAVSVLSNRQEELLFESRWVVLRKICSVGKHVASFDRQAQVFQVNEWLAIKHIEGLDAISADIQATWDTTALEPQFGLVKNALLDEADDFFRLAPTVLESGGIQRAQLEDWPVFADLRKDSRFAGLLSGQSGM